MLLKNFLVEKNRTSTWSKIIYDVNIHFSHGNYKNIKIPTKE
jgi:hypothetical protein